MKAFCALILVAIGYAGHHQVTHWGEPVAGLITLAALLLVAAGAVRAFADEVKKS